MNLIDYVTHPRLGAYVKEIDAGEYLFRQGQAAASIIFIISGRVRLIGEKQNSEFVASLLEAGEFLGEKAILQDRPYQRLYSAKAQTHVSYLEFTKADIEGIESQDPPLIGQLFRGLLQVIAHRFDSLNYLTRILRSSNNVERLIGVIMYLGRTCGKKFPGGTQLLLSPESIHHYIDMDKTRITTALDDLIAQKLLIPEGPNLYLIPNQQALVEYVPTLVSRLAA